MVYRAFTICIFYTLSLISVGSANADIVNFVLDATQSHVDVTVAGVGPDRSQTSGTGALFLTPSTPPFGVAQITDLDIVLDDALFFSLFAGLVTATTTAGDVTVELVTPGAPGTVSSSQFDQTGNSMRLGGSVVIDDDNGIVGGDQTLDLSTLADSVVDFNAVTLSRTGDVVTISGTYDIAQSIDAGNGTSVPIVIAGVFVASGVVMVPEPSGMVVLLATFGIVVGRRRRS